MRPPFNGLKLLVTCACIVVALVVVLPAEAETWVSSGDQVVFVVPDPCRGEPIVAAEGRYHSVLTMQTGPSGRVLLNQSYHVFATFTTSSGTEWSSHEVWHHTQTYDLRRDSAEHERYVVHVSKVPLETGPGDVRFVLITVYTITIDPSGTVTALHSSARIGCV